ncbi:tRNA-dependent cyclodipeptide synthase [Streptomyces sp. 891-h]|uniref:tRNA-dependent cyclodipeptide synthase n=1 Tax=Streptomyces sp. 891-h TaxID=2720714 RepID=UPI001FA9DB25|nr:tRNA-dependent cyclodipeptide synthase [Streptomyces sp. 891-h]UNZ21274.1 tRNA-dependent cyclodipeptide synthase [Streptomyces sp. 891-h]
MPVHHESSRPPAAASRLLPADRNEGFSVAPLTDNCRRVYEQGRHLVIGISHGNSYFSVSLLTRMLRWSRSKFDRIDVVVPDDAFRENLSVLGYSPEYAERKSRQESNAIRNRVVRAAAAADVPVSAEMRVHLLSGLLDNPVYRALRRDAEEALHADVELLESCLHMSRRALWSSLRGKTPTEEQVRSGARYPLAELPFFLGSADIFQVPSSLCFYHKPIPLADALFRKRTSLAPSMRQGYAIIQPS